MVFGEKIQIYVYLIKTKYFGLKKKKRSIFKNLEKGKRFFEKRVTFMKLIYATYFGQNKRNKYNHA